MIHYNPELHHDKVIAFLRQTDFWTNPYEPSCMRYMNDGTPICDIEMDGEIMIFKCDTLQQLANEAAAFDILPSLKERDSGVIGSSLRCRSYATSPQSRCPDS